MPHYSFFVFAREKVTIPILRISIEKLSFYCKYGNWKANILRHIWQADQFSFLWYCLTRGGAKASARSRSSEHHFSQETTIQEKHRWHRIRPIDASRVEVTF